MPRFVRTTTLLYILILAAIAAVGHCPSAMAQEASMGKFVDLGVPVTRAAIFKQTLGPDGNGEMTRIYAVFTQNAAPVFLVQINPDTGEAKQFNAPIGTHPWGLTVGPDNCVYVGTAGDAKQGGLLLKFDPAAPEKGLVNLGKMAESETYIWSLANGEGDDCIYGCTYGNGKVASYNTRTGEMRDYGQLSPGQQYTRPIVVGKDGWVYTAVGTTAPDYVALDPRTGEHHSSRPAGLAGTPVEELEKGGWGQFRKGIDGHAYQKDCDKWYRLVAGAAEPVEDAQVPAGVVPELKDGRRLVGVYPEGRWVLRDPATNAETAGEFTYESAGMEAFVLGEGPDGCIYGSTMLPLWLFRTDPRTGLHEVLGNPSKSGGELYSFLTLDGLLWTFGYPNAYVSSYDPTRPWSFGDAPENNPRNFGTMGDGHLRPRAVILGPQQQIYVGSYAPYGELGGAMGVLDPATGKVTENYRNLIPNQSICALAYDAASNLIFGGTSIAGGGGTQPSEKEAVFFVWDPVQRKLTNQCVPVAGDTTTPAIAVANGKVFIFSRPSNTLSVYDIASSTMVEHRPIEYGPVVEICLGLHTDGMIYGLTNRAVIRIDPATHEISRMATWDKGVRCGWVMNEDGIYFASGVHLIRWEWPE